MLDIYFLFGLYTMIIFVFIFYMVKIAIFLIKIAKAKHYFYIVLWIVSIFIIGFISTNLYIYFGGEIYL